jgi:ElaB/YqjD/DUF883 family membrane-anchored ribosome-binding protein
MPTSTTSKHDDDLAAQVAQLQADLKSITKTLQTMAGTGVDDAQGLALHGAEKLVAKGSKAMHDVQDEFTEVEKQLKDTIRERPLTAVAGALALGFLLAALSR